MLLRSSFEIYFSLLNIFQLLDKNYHELPCCIIYQFLLCCCHSYAYSEEAAEEFDKDETSLTHIKPYTSSPDDDETRALRGSDVESDNEVDEDKTE